MITMLVILCLLASQCKDYVQNLINDDEIFKKIIDEKDWFTGRINLNSVLDVTDELKQWVLRTI